MDYIDALITYICAFPAFYIYFFLFISAFTENICPPIPGDTIIAFGAFLAGRNKLSFSIAYISTTLGSLAGFMLVFWFGLYVGKNFFMERNLFFFKKEHIVKTEHWLKKYGYIIILFNRYIPGVRAVVSITSGILKLSPSKVTASAFVGCATWNILIMYIGLHIGSNWQEIKSNLSYLLTRYNLIAITILALFISSFLLLKYLKKRS